MSWPFTNPATGPSDIEGPGAAVPTSATEIAGGTQAWILGIDFYNGADDPRDVTITNSADVVLYKTTIQPKSMPPPYSAAFRPTLGMKWFASDTGVLGHVYGYQ